MTHFLSHTVIDGSLGAGILGPTCFVESQMILAIQYVVTGAGSPTGNIILQLSLDGVTWFTGDTKAITAATTYYKDLGLIAAPYARVIFTSASGTGVLNAWITGK